MPAPKAGQAREVAPTLGDPIRLSVQAKGPPGRYDDGGSKGGENKEGEKKACEEGDLNPHGCYPTSPSN